MTAADAALPLSDDEAFSVFQACVTHPHVALALSGGPDSMALGFMLSRYAAAHGGHPVIHALTVDHGLRPESTDEAQHVGQWVRDWPHMTHHVLNWQGDKPESRVMEEARRARYDLMRGYCAGHGIQHLFLGHHQDDQAETFLIRLAAGSGLDGLSGMRPVQEIQGGISLVRPFLPFSKDRLIATCQAHGVPFVKDPSNEKDDYLRPRLRAARAALEEEGLSNKRLAVTASRLARARAALEQVTEQAFKRVLKHQDDTGTLYDFSIFLAEPEEVRLRLLLKAVDYLRPDEAYAPRMERVEELLRALCADGFKSRTLGGCLFAMQDAGKALWVGKE